MDAAIAMSCFVTREVSSFGGRVQTKAAEGGLFWSLVLRSLGLPRVSHPAVALRSKAFELF